MSYHLITTADERSWRFDCPVVFLNNHCQTYNRKKIWKNMESITADPYPLLEKKKENDYLETKKIEKKLFPIFCEQLNKYHNTEYSLRFWKIVLGHWFRRYIEFSLYHIKIIQYCLSDFSIESTTFLYNSNYSLTVLNSSEFISAICNDRWRNLFYIEVIKKLNTSISIDKVEISDSQDIFRDTSLDRKRTKKQKVIDAILSSLVKDNDALITKTYLPRKEMVKLNLLLGQIPQIYALHNFLPKAKVDYHLRNDLEKNFSLEVDNLVEKIIHSFLFKLLPVCYLEGFFELKEKTKKMPWPKNPKFIFTGNSFDINEIFKLWTAIKVESGCQYIISQHGNTYGTHKYFNPTVEEEIADKFITWGWSDGLKQHTPAFIFKTINTKKDNYNIRGNLLLIEAQGEFEISSWENVSNFEYYFEQQKIFITHLNNNLKEDLIIRLHHAYHKSRYYENLRWRDFNNKLKIDTGNIPINDLIAQSRLIVHSYDSTGILESLSKNIPTIAFWQNNFDHLRDSAKPYYQLLLEVGIIHLTPESAANKINLIWDDVMLWWEQKDVQQARKKFCDRYAREPIAPLRTLKNILTSN